MTVGKDASRERGQILDLRPNRYSSLKARGTGGLQPRRVFHF